MEKGELALWGFAIYGLVVLAYSSYRSWRINRWPYVVGTLLKADIDYIYVDERGSALEDLRYEYEVDGVHYTGSRLSPLIVRGQVGPRIRKQLAKIQYISTDQVKVYYDPRKPHKCFLVKETWLNLFG